MIIARAPMRISFVGGGTDLPDYYRLRTGKVISATIDKYVYVVINPAPLLKGVSARYSIIENVTKVNQLKNTRLRETMLKLGIKENLEVGVFSHLKAGIGLGGSSSFTVALLKGFTGLTGKRFDNTEIACKACEIEIELLREPIGKQDQYAAALGGFNIFHFNQNGSVSAFPVHIDYKKRLDFENHILVFFLGITRPATTVLTEQKRNTNKQLDALTQMAQLVESFKENIMQGNFKELGSLLHQNWLIKKQLASKITNPKIESIYDTGIKNGAWGGKVLGAGGGGCILFLSPVYKKNKIRKSITSTARKLKLKDFKEIPIKFVQSGVEILSNTLF